MNIPFVQAKSLSYSGTRSYSSIYYIIIHYTGINNDTAENEAKFFATGNTRSAGAHFFVGQNGHIVQSVKMSYTANSVPRKRQGYSGGGTFLGKCTSANSISIEMCDNLSKDPSAKQTEAVRQLVEYIQSICPNARSIVRHYDVTGKLCPARMVDEKKWLTFKAAITAKQQPKQEVEDLTKEETIKLFDELIEKKLGGKGLPESKWAADEGVVSASVSEGFTDGTRPQGYAKREEVWGMILRVLKAGGDND